MCLHAKLLQSCPTLCNPMDCSLPGSSVHGILQARKLEWVAIPYSRGSSSSRDRTRVSYVSVSCIGGRVPYHKRHMGSPESAIHIYICVYTIYMYRCIPSFLGFPPLAPHPVGPHRALCWAPCADSSFPLALVSTWSCMHLSVSLSVRPGLFRRRCV